MKATARSLAALMTVLIFAAPQLPAAAGGSESLAERAQRLAWWRGARFGMFVVWGAYAVPAGEYKGSPVSGGGEWIMNCAKIPVADYKQFAAQFNPTNYHPEQLVLLAKNAGMKYLVVTAKHHDGFALFDSKVTDWDMVDATPYGKDLLTPLAEACRTQGLKLGFYYSQAQDWHHPGGAAAGGHWDKAQDGSMDEYLTTVAMPQVRELLAHYGPVSVFWWVTPVDMTEARARQFLPLLAAQPGIIINNRLGGGVAGDFDTPEQRIPPTGDSLCDWETCMTINDTWGFKRDDTNWKSAQTLIRNLVDIASKGGNYLLNIGPAGDGSVPAASIERLKDIGAWMAVNGEAIHDTTASPFESLPWGRCTKRVTTNETILYLHVFSWPVGGLLCVPDLMNKVNAAWLLADPERKPLKTQNAAARLVINVPVTAPDPVCSVVALRLSGMLDIRQNLVRQNDDGSFSLLGSSAILDGQEICYEVERDYNAIGSWKNAEDLVSWKLDITRPGIFEVTANLAATEKTSFQVIMGNTQLTCVVPKTDSAAFRTLKLGAVMIPKKGVATLSVKPVQMGWRPVTLRSLSLSPVAFSTTP